MVVGGWGGGGGWFMLCGFGAILFGVRGVWFVWSVRVGRLGMEPGEWRGGG